MILSDWIKIAEQNREVDFFYKGVMYSISVNGKWYLTQYGDYENAQEFNSFLELIHDSKLYDTPFIDICEMFDVNAIY